MINVLFWNVNQRSGLESVLVDLIRSLNIDILLLAEGNNLKDERIEQGPLKRVPQKLAVRPGPFTPKFFTSNKGFHLESIGMDVVRKRLVYCILSIQGKSPILFGGIHFPSKKSYDLSSQNSLASLYARDIYDKEAQLDHSFPHDRTLVLGDFNMNPFEPGMINPLGFNATLSSSVAMQGKRTFGGGDYLYFYNPMWNLMGDRSLLQGKLKLPGSYFFHTTSDVNSIFWNIFDGVILRKGLVDEIYWPSFRLIEKVNGHTLVHKHAPGEGHNFEYIIAEDQFSDHVPLFFQIKKQ